nr:outer membrane beta-barrel protein [Allomuricauda sp.]
MGKKDLEQLFKEKLGDFQETPDSKVWNSIETSLDKQKQKRRVIPIWWRLGGAAAVLAILLYVINPFGAADNEGQIIVDTENPEMADPQNEVQDISDPNIVPDGNGLVNTEDANPTKTTGDEGTESKSGKSNTKGNNPSLQSIPSGITENALAENDKASESDLVNTQENSGNALATATNNNAKVATQTNQDSDPVKNEMETLTETEAVAQNQANKQLPAKENGNTVLNNEIPEKEKEIVAQNDEAKQDEKQSIFDVIAEQEEEVVAGTNGDKWSIGPTVAPVYFSASGEGSPVHSTFASNSKSGNVDLSYGLTVAYEVGKKLKIRTGVHRVNYGYDTNDVVFTSSLDGSVNLIDNINYSSDSQNIVLESKNKGALSVEKAELASDASAILDGKMIQNLGYLEIPLELNYSLIDKKFGVDLIGGLSSLFLVDNAVLLESEGLVTEVGEANNVNTTNFSTNIGVGFNYQFSPKVQLNLEPMFKYQLNTFSDTAGSFRPFSVGVYSGFSFKF